MKVGVLGGTFDPVHLGHIRMAEEARDALGLDRVLLVPAGQPMTKPDLTITSSEHRLNMLQLAVKDKPRLLVSPIEIERPGPTYTVDTITALKQDCGPGTIVLFILGWDSLEQLPAWKQPECLVEMCYFVAIPRPGFKKPNMLSLEQKIPGITKKVIFLEKPIIDISSTAIREKIAGGEKINKLVAGPVAEYIKKHNLYHSGGKS
jgi:nicotinate-nucleotide adenylyltransferase